MCWYDLYDIWIWLIFWRIGQHGFGCFFWIFFRFLVCSWWTEKWVLWDCMNFGWWVLLCFGCLMYWKFWVLWVYMEFFWWLFFCIGFLFFSSFGLLWTQKLEMTQFVWWLVITFILLLIWKMSCCVLGCTQIENWFLVWILISDWGQGCWKNDVSQVTICVF